ncbi:cyclin-T1-3-like [Impatiens glandulifera]|uniref:cyclin-T1-3-like n=1 Tax=Impatiens glandulifera TaxID=253017 RepID=UPI001FB05CBF|nr:cyclin-T1-3-like [Impatiens glandulifera]XP_047336630.1 cyclin-T1-3-like [Impatiens glandulifera]XP_047336631.1 cyclin-T1-3-like [Impatiens glandulifera]XP_047336632.1 cyclin-T1-3-like [Impatiens glandulifera]
MEVEHQCLSQKWYFSRQEIEEYSPSRKHGIDLCAEMAVRKLYSSFLQELGMELKVPQQTIATAIMFCHRFYLRHSLAKNDWQTIASACMFLACKVEETPRKINSFVVYAYKRMHQSDVKASQRIIEKEVLDKQKNLILIGEKMILATIAYDMNLEHPYKPLVAALKNLNISNREIPKVAWNYVNDCLQTTLCLQYKPGYVAAGSLFLAAKHLGVKLPIQNGKAWRMQFDISRKLLEEVVQEMVTLLNMNIQPPPSSGRVIQSKPAVHNMKSDSSKSCTINVSPVGGAANTATSEVRLTDDSPSDRPSLPEKTSQESNSGTTVSVVEDNNGEPRDVESCQNPNYKFVSSLSVGRQLDMDQNQIREMSKRKRSEEYGTRKLVNHCALR